MWCIRRLEQLTAAIGQSDEGPMARSPMLTDIVDGMIEPVRGPTHGSDWRRAVKLCDWEVDSLPAWGISF